MAGVGDPKVIDLVTHRPKTDEAILVMTETREWGPEGALLLQLQEKFQTYLDFVEHGELDRKFPHLSKKRLIIRLDTVNAPGAMELEFLRRAKREWLDPAGIGLEWGLLSNPGYHAV